MSALKVIQTEYKGYKFRSRLEARWAVFFDACGVSWEYEPEGFVLSDGKYYLPDFLLHGVDGRGGSDLYVEVKGKMTEEDAEKIICFSGIKDSKDGRAITPILVLPGIPDGENIDDIDQFIMDMGYDGFPGFKDGPYPFNFKTVDGDYFAAYPGVNKEGHFELFGDDSNYLRDRNEDATLKAFIAARQARFEYGETPRRRFRHA